MIVEVLSAMFSVFSRSTAFILMICAVSACAFAPKGEPLPSLTFAHLKAIPITVQAINVDNSDAGISDTFVMPPEAPLADYMQNRFQPVGLQNTLHIMIEQARVEHRHVEAEERFAKFWDIGGAEHYDVKLTLRIEHRDAFGSILYGTVLNATRRIKMSEHLSIAERERIQLEALEVLFEVIDENMQRIVLKEMSLRAPSP